MATTVRPAETEQSDTDNVMRTMVQARIARKEFRETPQGVGLCVLTVIGNPSGQSGAPAARLPLRRRRRRGARPDEASRCNSGLKAGDLIHAVGDIGPDRPEAERQEVIVTAPVRLRERAAAA